MQIRKTLLAASALTALAASPLLMAGCGATAAAITPESRPDTALLRATFDSVWNRILNSHFDPEGILPAWEAAREELRPRALEARSNEELRPIIRELLTALGESHFVLIPEESVGAFGEGDARPPDERGLGAPGFDLRRVEGSLAVVRVRRGSAAERAGVAPGWVLEEVDGVFIDSLELQLRESARTGEEDRTLDAQLPLAARFYLLGSVGDTVRLRFRTPDGALRHLALPREAPEGEIVRFGSLPPFPVALTSDEVHTGESRRVGLIRMTGWFPPVVVPFAAGVDRFREADGIVLDLRGNPGGLGGLVMGIGGHFVDEALDLGTFRSRESALRFVINPQRVAPDGRRVAPFAGPLAILVDPLSASTSEIFAAGMQAIGRARIFGEPTPGYALPSVLTPLPNGDRLMHAVADYVAPDGTRIEGRGVHPDASAPPTFTAFARGEDAALLAALRWIDSFTKSARPFSRR